MSEETEIMEKKYPFAKAVIDYTLKRIGLVICPLLISGVIGGCNYMKQLHDVKWIGQHLNDKQTEINKLKNNSSEP